jgi:hypothetical protein
MEDVFPISQAYKFMANRQNYEDSPEALHTTEMFSTVQFVLCTVFAYVCCVWGVSATPKPVVIDTDILGDVDDVGALAVANTLHNCGMADLRGVVVNTHSQYSSIAVSAVNTWFGNGDIPIGALRPINKEVFFDDVFFS